MGLVLVERSQEWRKERKMIAETRIEVKDLIKLLGQAGLALIAIAIVGSLLVAVTCLGGCD